MSDARRGKEAVKSPWKRWRIEGCRSDDDGYCTWRRCPQRRDGEPAKSGRHCPREILAALTEEGA